MKTYRKDGARHSSEEKRAGTSVSEFRDVARADGWEVLVSNLHARGRHAALHDWGYPIREIVKYENYKRFGAKSRITYEGQEIPKSDEQKKPEETKADQSKPDEKKPQK